MSLDLRKVVRTLLNTKKKVAVYVTLSGLKISSCICNRSQGSCTSFWRCSTASIHSGSPQAAGGGECARHRRETSLTEVTYKGCVSKGWEVHSFLKKQLLSNFQEWIPQIFWKSWPKPQIFPLLSPLCGHPENYSDFLKHHSSQSTTAELMS